MLFHTFGNPDNKAIVLVHGVLTPWQMWEYQTDKLKDDYYVLIPALDAHTEETVSEFVSVEKEAEEIENYIINHLNGKVYAVCGISMGAVISSIIWKNNRIQIDKLVMDGAPFAKIPNFMVRIMISNYLTIVHSSQKRDPKTLAGFSKNLLPEKYLGNYLAFIDTMSDESVRNMVSSVCQNHYPSKVESTTKVLFLHGTKANESVAAKAAKRLKSDYPEMKIICRKGMVHCENALFHPERWYEEVRDFLDVR